MQTLARQRGLTFISIVVILLVLGFFVMLTLKIWPIYNNHYVRVKPALQKIEKDPTLETLTTPQIMSKIHKYFDLNYVDHVKDENIIITKHGGELIIDLEYEVVAPVCCHLSILAQFKEVIHKGK